MVRVASERRFSGDPGRSDGVTSFSVRAGDETGSRSAAMRRTGNVLHRPFRNVSRQPHTNG
jgi:hypothetical protein